jgi:Cof subfamily protein (haloacid dehalogenase superfamily)
MPYRLLAVDLDGTLMDPNGKLTDAARQAVAAAQDAGLQVVLCTGRRFRTTLPVLRALELEGCVVVNNGAVVKEIASGKTLHRDYLPAEIYPDVVALVREHGPPLVYVDSYPDATDILTEPHGKISPYQADYIERQAAHRRFVDDLAAAQRDDVILVSQMADLEALRPLEERARQVLGARVKTHFLENKSYGGHILEILSPSSDKWAALAQVAADAGIAPPEIAAIGDDVNDIELVRRAGLGIAMANGAEETRAAADVVVRSNAEKGVVEAIERVLAGR